MTEIRSAIRPCPSRLGNVSGALLMGESIGDSMRDARSAAGLLGEQSRGAEMSRMPMGRSGRDGSAPSAPCRIAETLDRLFVETIVVGGDGAKDIPGTRISEADGPPCALRALVSAFEAATRDRVLVVTDDLPYLNADLLLALTAWPEADAVVPVGDRGAEPLCAIYRRETCLAIGRQRLEANRVRLDDWLDALETFRVSLSLLGFGPEECGLLSRIEARDASAVSEAR